MAMNLGYLASLLQGTKFGGGAPLAQPAGAQNFGGVNHPFGGGKFIANNPGILAGLQQALSGGGYPSGGFGAGTGTASLAGVQGGNPSVLPPPVLPPVAPDVDNPLKPPAVPPRFPPTGPLPTYTAAPGNVNAGHQPIPPRKPNTFLPGSSLASLQY